MIYKNIHNVDIAIRFVGFAVAGVICLVGSEAHAWLEPEISVADLCVARIEMDRNDRENKANVAFDRIERGSYSERDSDRAYDYMDRDWK